MKRILIPLALLLFSAAVFFLFVLPAQLERRLQEMVPDSLELSYQDFQLNLLDQSVVLDSLKLQGVDGQQLEAERLELRFDQYLDGTVSAQLDQLQLTAPDNQTLAAERVSVQEIDHQSLQNLEPADSLGSLLQSLPPETLKQLQLEGVSLQSEGQQLSVRSLGVETLGEGQLYGLQAEGVTSSDAEKELSINSVQVDQVRLSNLEQLAANQLQFGGMSLKDGESDLTIEDLTVEQIGEDQLKQLRMEKLRLQNFEELQELNVESVEAQTLPLITEFEDELDLLQQLLGSRFENLRIRNLFLQPREEESKRVREIELEQLGFGATEGGYHYIQDLELKILGIVVKLSDFPEDIANQARNFTASEEIGMNLFLDIGANHQNRGYELSLGVGLENMADLLLEGRFANVPLELFEFEKYANDELASILEQKWTKIGIASLTARYDERGFLGYSMDKLRSEVGVSQEAIAQQVSQQFQQTAARYNLKDSERLATELEQFVREPKTLRVGFLPDVPLNFEEIAMLALLNPGMLQQKSNFSIQSSTE